MFYVYFSYPNIWFSLFICKPQAFTGFNAINMHYNLKCFQSGEKINWCSMYENMTMYDLNYSFQFSKSQIFS